MPHFLDDITYRSLAERVANIEPCPFAGRVTSDQVKIALGEFGEIWPECIRPDHEARRGRGTASIGVLMLSQSI